MRTVLGLRRVVGMFVSVLGFAVATARGGTILQDQGTGAATIYFFQPIGQSFVAQEADMVSIAFAFYNMNPSDANSPVTMTLYAGSGIGGTVVDSVTQTLPANLPSTDVLTLDFIDFNFSGDTLVVGNAYTAAVTTLSYKDGVAYNYQTDAYLGGQMFYSGTLNSAGYDLDFRVTSVPEPSMWTFLVLASAALAARRTIAV